jgi:hypothetical protein
MPTTSLKYSSSSVNLGSDIAWTSPAYGTGGPLEGKLTYAYCYMGTSLSNYLVMTNFNLAIPAGHRLTQLYLSYRQERGDFSYTGVSNLYIVIGGSVSYEVASIPDWSISGFGNLNIWTPGLTADQANATNFGIAVRCQGYASPCGVHVYGTSFKADYVLKGTNFFFNSF